MIGLGRMGANMVRRLIRNGHQCVVYDRSEQAAKDLVKEKAVGATSLADFRKEAAEAARRVADGAGRGRRRLHRRPRLHCSKRATS